MEPLHAVWSIQGDAKGVCPVGNCVFLTDFGGIYGQVHAVTGGLVTGNRAEVPVASLGGLSFSWKEAVAGQQFVAKLYVGAAIGLGQALGGSEYGKLTVD